MRSAAQLELLQHGESTRSAEGSGDWSQLREQLKRRQDDLEAAEQRLRREQNQSRRLHQQLLEELEQRRLELEARHQQGCWPTGLELNPDGDAALEAEALAAERRELETQRAQLEEDHHQWESHWRRRQAELEELENQQEASLRQRSQVLDQRRIATLRVHQQTARMHREMLEMRLAIEHLWSQLVQKNRPGWLVKTLGQLKRRIHASLRQEQQQIQQRRAELTVLAERVREHQLRLKDQQARLAQWAKDREQQLDQQADSLEKWESDLRRQRRELMRFRVLWRQEQQRAETRLDDWPVSAAAT